MCYIQFLYCLIIGIDHTVILLMPYSADKHIIRFIHHVVCSHVSHIICGCAYTYNIFVIPM